MSVILSNLESEQAESLIDALYKRATEKHCFIVTCFDYIAPECTYDTPGCFDAPNLIAYGPGARSKNGSTNQQAVSVAEIREELIQSAIIQFDENPIFANKTYEEKVKFATDKIWPPATAGARERERNEYNLQAHAIFAYAESLMTKDMRTLMNQYEPYSIAKSKRCVIGYIEAIRTKCANGTENKEINREHIEKAIKDLRMGNSLDSYIEFKSKFTRLINNLRKCTDGQVFDESLYVSKFLARLDQNLFDKVYMKRCAYFNNEIKAIKTLDEVYRVSGKMYDSIRMFCSEVAVVDQAAAKSQKTESGQTATTTDNDNANIFAYDHSKKAKPNNAKNGGNNNSNNSKQNNNNNSSKADNSKKNNKNSAKPKNAKTQEKKQKICSFYDPDDPSKCKYGDKCNKTHLEDKDLWAEFKKMNEERSKFFSKL